MAPTDRTHVNVKLDHYRAEAYEDAAARCGVTRHAWMVARLDHAAGVAPLPEGGKWGKRLKARPHPGVAVGRTTVSTLTVTVKCTGTQSIGWSRAAGAAGITRQPWCRIVLDAAAGFEGLARQLARITE